MLLLTGATGTIGKPLLRRLTARGTPVRCLVRDPRRLGSDRVRVQIALGDLADHRSYRTWLRGVDTVVHLAAPLRDQPAGSVEELAAVATGRLLRAAERAGAHRFVFFSAIGAVAHSPSRLMRAKAIAEQAILDSSLQTTVFAPSWVYAPDDPFMTILRRFARLPVMPVAGSGAARFEPIWAEDVADCIDAVLPGGPRAGSGPHQRIELAGPEQLSYREIVRLSLRSFGRDRPIVPVPTPLVRRTLDLGERLFGERTVATWDEAQLLRITMLARNGVADVERLGVVPQSMEAVLGVVG